MINVSSGKLLYSGSSDPIGIRADGYIWVIPRTCPNPTNNKYMENKIYRKKDKIIIEIPFYDERSNPYDPDYARQMDNIVGLICPEKGCSEPEMGFSQNIDMSYKGKPDQETDFFYKYWGEKEDFIKLCKDLGIEVREIPACAYCGAPLFGCFTVGKKGDMCDDCSSKDKLK